MSATETASLDSFRCRKTLTAAGKTYSYFDLKAAEANGLAGYRGCRIR